MSEAKRQFTSFDNGGRRTGMDRRYFSYSDHIPERRVGEGRRKTPDRRRVLDRRGETGQRLFGSRNRLIYVGKDVNQESGLDRRRGEDRRSAFA